MNFKNQHLDLRFYFFKEKLRFFPMFGFWVECDSSLERKACCIFQLYECSITQKLWIKLKSILTCYLNGSVLTSRHLTELYQSLPKMLLLLHSRRWFWSYFGLTLKYSYSCQLINNKLSDKCQGNLKAQFYLESVNQKLFHNMSHNLTCWWNLL